MQQLEVADPLLGEDVAVAGGQHHRQVRHPPPEEPGQRDPAHPGHDHVGEHDVEGRAVGPELIQRLLGIGRPGRRVAEILQDLRGEAADLDVVLHHQHALPRAAGIERGRLRGGGRAGRLGLDLRQVEREGGAAAGRALDRDVAAGLLGEAEDLGQAEARALPDLLGGEERLEHPCQDVRRDAGAGVGEGDRRERAGGAGMATDRRQRRAAMQAQGQRAGAVHGVPGVHRHVDQRGLELAEVDPDEAGLVRQLGHDRDAGARDRVEQVGHAAQPRADVEDLGLQRLPPREGEELAGELGRPVHRLRDGVEVAGPALLRQIGTAQEVHRRADDRQEVVEVVGDAAGELPHRLQLLRLPQGLLGVPERLGLGLLGGDVAAVGVDVRALDGGAPRDQPRGAVLVPVAVLEIGQVARGRGGVEGLPGRARILRPDEVQEAAAHHLGRLVPQDRLPGRVDRAEDAVGPDHDQEVARVAPDPVVLGGALGHALLEGHVEAHELGHEPLLVVDVGAGADPAGDRAVGRPDRLRPGQEPAIGAVGAAQAVLGLVVGPRPDGRPPFLVDPVPVVGVDDPPPARPVEGAGLPARVGVDALVEPVRRPAGVGRPDEVRQHLRQDAELRLAGAQGLLGLLAGGDVDRRADHPHAAPALEDPAPLGGDPAHDAVLLADGAVLDVVEGAPVGIEGGGEGRARGLPVLGMQAGVVIGHRDRHVGRDPEHRLDPRRPEQGVGDDVDVPEADLGRLGREPQAPLALPQLLLGPVAHRVVEVQPVPDQAVADAAGRRDDARPDAGAVRPAHRRLDVEMREVADRAGLGLGEAGAVLRQDQVVGDGRVGEDRLGRHAGHALESLRHVEEAPVRAVGGHGELVDVAAREVVGERADPRLRLPQPRLGQDAAGRLRAGAVQAGDPAGLVAHRRVREGEPGRLVVAVPVHGQGHVLGPGRRAGERPVDQGPDLGPDLRPDVAEARAERRGMLVAQDLRVGVVVEEDEVGPERHEHREARAQDQAQRRPQARRPALRPPERRAGPVVGAHPRAHRAALREEGQIRGPDGLGHGTGTGSAMGIAPPGATVPAAGPG